MPKQPSRSRLKAKQPSKKQPKTPNNRHKGPVRMASPELMQPSTNSDPTFNRQLGGQPNLDPAREVFRRSHDRIMAARGPKAQVPALSRSAIAAFTERSIFEQLLAQHQDEIERLSKELAAEKQQNTELKARLLEADGLPTSKRKRSGGTLPVELDPKG